MRAYANVCECMQTTSIVPFHRGGPAGLINRRQRNESQTAPTTSLLRLPVPSLPYLILYPFTCCIRGILRCGRMLSKENE